MTPSIRTQTPRQSVDGAHRFSLTGNLPSGDDAVFRAVPSDPNHRQIDGPHLQESFSLWSLAGVMASSQATPIVIGTFLSLIVGVGGPPAYVWGFICAATFSFMIMFSLAEICSVYPCPAGQIYWSAVLSKNGQSRLTSYLCGWITAFGWFLYVAGTYMIIAEFICALVTVYHPSVVFTTWQVYLINVGVSLLLLLWNGPFFKLYTKATTGMLYFFNLGALFIFLALLIKSSPKQPARAVFIDMINETGWTSNGVVFFIATGPLTSGVSAFDTATHLADEVPNPARTIPIVMIISTCLSFVGGLAMVLAYMFSVKDLDALSDPVGGIPLIQLFVDAFDNDGLAIVSTAIIIIGMVCAAASTMCTASRTWWAFARLNGTPGAAWLGKIDERFNLPMNALYLLTLMSFAFTAIIMGSTTALNAILGGGGACVLLSYSFPIIQLLRVGRGALPSKRYLNLGVAGLPLNIAAALWIPFMTAFECFPLYLPATADTMNYTSVIVMGMVIFATANWFLNSRKTYVIPGWETHEGVALETSETNSNDPETNISAKMGPDGYLVDRKIISQTEVK